jgi:hypothetical protein
VVFQLARPSKSKPDEPFVEVPHAQIHPLNVTGANPVLPWRSRFDFDFNADERGWGIGAANSTLDCGCRPSFLGKVGHKECSTCP